MIDNGATYIGSLPNEEVGKYRTIYNIANDEVLILECQRIGQDVHLRYHFC